MELLNPAGLLWLAALPLLLVPYWLRQRPRPRRVPALFLYEGIDKAQQLRLGGRLHLRPLVLLQLLLLLLAVAALCRPLLRSNQIRSALVLDNSASLQATDDVGESRFAAARKATAKELDKDSATSWDLFTLSPEPREVALDVSRGDVGNRIGRVQVGSCPHPDDGALKSFLERLARQNYSQIHVVTDRQAKSSGNFQVVTVGIPRANVAITDLTLVPAGMSGQTSNVNVAVENFSAKPANVPITIEDATTGRTLTSGRLDLGARGSASFAAEVPAGTRLRARIVSEDALALDNQAALSAPAAGNANVLLVSANGGGLERLERALGIRLEVVTPESYRPDLGRNRDLVIFHLAAPAEAPPSSALYLLPPDMPYLPATAGRIDAPTIAFPNPTHPAVRYLNSAALRPRYALTLRGSAEWESLALANGGPVLLGRQSGGRMQVVSGVDILPYAGERNRPVSILALNLLSWLVRGSASQHRGEECLPLGAAESNLEKRPELPLPAVKASDLPASSKSALPLWPGLVLATLALLALEAWFQRGSGGFLWVVRTLVVALLAASAFDPARHLPGAAEKPLVVADVSRSMLPEVRARELAGLRRITGPAGVAVAFGAEPVPSTVAGVDQAGKDAGPDQTDIESALRLAAGQAPQGSPLLLLTDGWETRGDVRRALDSLSARQIRVYPFAAPQPIASNVAVESLSLPAESAAGRAVRAEVMMRNDNLRPVSGRVTIRQAGKVVSQADVKLPPGQSMIARPVLVTGEGLVEFSAELQAADPATNVKREDDLAKSWIAIGGRRKILLVGHTERENRDLAAALTQRGFHATAVATAGGARPPDAGGFGAVILNDVAIGDLPRSYPEDVRDYVRGGGSLVMVGGPRSFGLGGYLGSPIEEALPVAMKERSREEPRNSVALVIDKSGSMREERRMVFAREAARQLVDHLNDRDRLAVIGFDREAFPLIPLSEVGEIRDDFERRIDRLKPSGGTRLFPALVEARRQLLGEEAKKRHIIVLSDGLSEDGETASGRRHYYDLALALAEQGVTISTIALGRDADADFLERLASYGRGAFHETRDASDLPEIVLGEFREHARERTMREREFRPVPSRDSPLVGDIARADARWPAVLGLVETERKPRARLDVAVAGSDAPLIASWEYGRGRAAAVTTDADGRWSDRWVRWGEWSRLWSGIAGWLVPESTEQHARFAIAYHDGVLEIDYSRFDKDPAGGVTARIVGPRGTAEEIPLERIALGHYRGRLATRAPGDYRIEIRRPQEGLARGGGAQITQPPLGYTVPATATGEWPRRDPNWGLLEEIAAKTGGKVNPPLDSIEPAPVPVEAVPLAPILLPAAMLLFLAELVLRRLRA